MDDNERPSYLNREQRSKAFRVSTGRNEQETGSRPHPRYPKLEAAEAPQDRARKMRQARLNKLNGTPVETVVMESSVPVATPGRKSRTRTKKEKNPAARPAFRFSFDFVRGLKTGRIPIAIGIVLILGLGYWVLTAPNFKVTNVKVNGSRYLDAAGVIAATGVDKQNVFFLNEDEVAKKIKQKPFVLDVKVSKSIPNQLQVDITERTTSVIWKAGSFNYLVDQDGVILEMTAKLTADQEKLQLINSLDPAPMQPGQKVDAVAVTSAPEIVQKMKAAGIAISSLDFSPTSGLIVVSAGPDGKPGPWRALFGSSAELEKKTNLLLAILGRSDLKWTFADLRFTEKPAIS